MRKIHVMITMTMILTLSIQAECLPVSRFLFEIPQNAGSIRKMQIDLNHLDDRWSAEMRSLRKDGKVFVGQVGCSKITENEYRCRRFDNGGEFNLITQPTPTLTLNFFTADQEGDEIRTFVTGAKDKPAIFTGEKAAASKKHSF